MFLNLEGCSLIPAGHYYGENNLSVNKPYNFRIDSKVFFSDSKLTYSTTKLNSYILLFINCDLSLTFNIKF